MNEVFSINEHSLGIKANWGAHYYFFTFSNHCQLYERDLEEEKEVHLLLQA